MCFNNGLTVCGDFLVKVCLKTPIYSFKWLVDSEYGYLV
jgi:hypothetical protein